MDDLKGKKLKDVLRDIIPPLIDRLRAHMGDKSKSKFAGRVGIDRTTISRYYSGRVVPLANLTKLATGLSLGQLGWLLGDLLKDRYKFHAFELTAQGSEVKEPAVDYDAPTLDELRTAVEDLDLTVLDPQDSVTLAGRRGAILDLCASASTHRAALETLLRGLRDSYIAARRRSTRSG